MLRFNATVTTPNTPRPTMWADSLQQAEQFHLLRLAAWGALCVVAGTLLTLLVFRRTGVGLLRHFAMHTAGWGVVVLAFAGIAWTRLGPRDHAGAVTLDRFLWLSVGFDAGLVLTGLTLAAAGWATGRRLGMIGAGTAVVVQGVALAALDLMMTGQVSR